MFSSWVSVRRPGLGADGRAYHALSIAALLCGIRTEQDYADLIKRFVLHFDKREHCPMGYESERGV